MSKVDINFYAQESLRPAEDSAVVITGYAKHEAPIRPGMFVLIRLNSSLSIYTKIEIVEYTGHSEKGDLLRITMRGDEDEMELLDALDIRDEVLIITNTLG
jgi:hypothetical protein